MAASTAAANAERLPTGRLIAHSALHTCLTSVQLPIAVFLPAIYASQYGLSLAVLGAIFLAERIWGTATDPLIGWLCDRTKSRFGRRKVWIAAGAAVYAVSTWLLFFPGKGVTPVYLATALVFVFLSLSMIQIPYYAWSGELTRDYHQRTRVTSYQNLATAIALFSVLLLPALVDRLHPGDEMMKLNAMGLVIAVPVIPLAILALWAFPDRSTAPVARRTRRAPLGEIMRTVMGEKVLIRVMLADFAIVFAQAMRGALFVFFVVHVAGLPQWASAMFLVQFVVGIAAAPIWQEVARRMGKHQALIVAEIGQALINAALLLVGRGDLALLAALTVAQGLMQGSGNQLLRAMLADVADEHRLRTGTDRTALLFSAFSISGKAGTALPVGIALPVVAWFGFDPAASINPSSGLWAVAILFALGPALAHLWAAVLVRGFSIDEERQAEIRRELESREAREDESAR